MSQCQRKKCGEYNMLMCVLESGHEGECSFIVDDENDYPHNKAARKRAAALRKTKAQLVDENDALRAELLQLREEKRGNLQCWLADDTERGVFDEQGMAEAIASWLADDGSTTEEVLCSTRLPNQHMRVWLTGGEDRDVNFEWVEKPYTPGL